MSNNKTPDKKKVLLIFAFVLLGVIIILIPFMRNLTGKNAKPKDETTSTPVITGGSSYADGEYESLYVDYTIYVDKKTFDLKEEDGKATIIAKDNSAVILTIESHSDVRYDELCIDIGALHDGNIYDKKLNVTNRQCAYSSRSGEGDEAVTSITYCIDNEAEGCIEINFTCPDSETDYAEKVELMLTMFKVL